MDTCLLPFVTRRAKLILFTLIIRLTRINRNCAIFIEELDNLAPLISQGKAPQMTTKKADNLTLS